MTTIYLMRHGETEWNVEKRFQGSADSSLTPAGFKQVENAAQWLGAHTMDMIYSSPRGRALQTASVIAAAMNREVHTHAGVSEISLGKWEGKEYRSVQIMDPEGYEAFFHRPSLFQGVDGGESLQAVQKRALNAVGEIAVRHRNQRILVISHAVTIRLLLLHYLSLGYDRLWEVAAIRQTSLSSIEFKGDRCVVGMMASVDHLKTERLVLNK